MPRHRQGGQPTRRPSNRKGPESQPPRLQRLLAAAGYGSRRKCEELIVAGRVQVDGAVISQLGTRVDPNQQEIRVDGTLVKRPKTQYFMVNKPPGILSTARDPWARARVIDLVPSGQRLFTIGRLDQHSSGLILVTNDGQLAQSLAHPRYGVAKTYQVLVAGQLSAVEWNKLKRGIHLAEAVVRPVRVRRLKSHGKSTLLEIVMTEGRNREIRRMLARLGHKVLRLTRVAIGPVRLGKLPVGAYRPLSSEEVAALRRARAPVPPKGASKNKLTKSDVTRPKSEARNSKEIQNTKVPKHR